MKVPAANETTMQINTIFSRLVSKDIGRSENRPGCRGRQLFSPLLGLFALLLLAPLWTVAAEPSPTPDPVEQEVAAARLLALTVSAKPPGPERTEAISNMNRVFRDLVNKHSGDARPITAHADFLWTVQDIPAALKQWKAAEKLDKADANIPGMIGAAELALGNTVEAAEAYKRAVELEPEQPGAQRDYANVAFFFRHDIASSTGQAAEEVLEEALAHYERAAELAPNDPAFARAYAETFYAMATPDLKKAIQAWERYAALDPASQFALVHIARLNIRSGKTDEARRALDLLDDARHSKVKKLLLKQLDDM